MDGILNGDKHRISKNKSKRKYQKIDDIRKKDRPDRKSPKNRKTQKRIETKVPPKTV